MPNWSLFISGQTRTVDIFVLVPDCNVLILKWVISLTFLARKDYTDITFNNTFETLRLNIIPGRGDAAYHLLSLNQQHTI